MDERKAKDLFCTKHYDLTDAEFHKEVALEGWLKDPLVRELFRRLLDAPGKSEALWAMEINAATQAALEAQKIKAWAEARQRKATELAVEEALSPIATHRKGPKADFLPFMVSILRDHGTLPKSSLVAACVAKWPDSRIAISNRINREIKSPDGLLMEKARNGFIALRWR